MRSFLQRTDKIIGLGPVAAVAIVLLTYFGSQLLAGILIGLGASILGYDASAILTEIESSTILQFSYTLIVGVLSLGTIFWFLRHRKVSLGQIGLGRKPKLGDVGHGLGVFVIYFVALIAVMATIRALIPGLDVDQEQQIGFKSAISSTELVLVFFSLAVLPPLIEEIMIRGFLYTGLRAKFQKILAAVIVSILFGLAHLQLGSGAPPLWTAAIDTVLLSLFLIYLRERTGSLWAGIFVHSLKNSMAFFVLFVLQR